MHFCALVLLMYCSFTLCNPHELHVPQSRAGRSVRSELQVRETLASHRHGYELEISYIPLRAWPESYRGCSFHPISWHSPPETSEHESSCCVVHVSCRPGNRRAGQVFAGTWQTLGRDRDRDRGASGQARPPPQWRRHAFQPVTDLPL